MANLKLLSAALFAAAVIAAPALAREHHASSRSVAQDTYAAAAPDAAYAGPVYGNGYRCIPAPRVGAFAGAPWTNSVPCEPAFVSPQAYY
ncbi:hypothetical protein [Bradyrhizobium sp. Tv2a-2]|uniref:hypothetical protein n=1 Tax=Bradyrhizobium sp. Tv2a-2 TaxID=113395 RepID=UPI0003F929B7|nr:hypothetical protein [Bradyrhizobium sp. Tv2a-2]